MKKYQLPEFLASEVSQAQYERWLHQKAVAHVRRDRKRGNKAATIGGYKVAIHKAVEDSEGRDAYTGERLDWTLISQYDNDKSKSGRREYKARFALLPSVDHATHGTGPADFKICAWRTNDAKSDLSYQQFVDLCRKVVAAANEHATE
jgi:hypothetical protein